MGKNVSITREEIVKQVTLSAKLPEIIEEIVSQKLINETANKAGISITPEEIQEAADLFRSANQLESADATYQWLEKYRFSVEDFEEMLYSNLILGKLANHMFKEKTEPYFYENQLDYFGVVMYEIVLDNEDLALELFYTIQEGEISFFEVANKYIQDTELRRKVGYRGIVYRKDLNPNISVAVFAASPPQLLNPIVTLEGVHLIFVEEIIQPQLNDKLRYKIILELFSTWLKKQTEQVEIIYDF